MGAASRSPDHAARGGDRNGTIGRPGAGGDALTAPVASTPTHADLLFEIGTEELPAPAIPGALAQLEGAARAALERARVSAGSVNVYGTPRRLTLIAERVVTRQADAATRVVGPPASAAFDAEGKPTRAAEGFAKSQGVAVDALTVVTTDKGRYAAVLQNEQGRPTAKILADILPRLIAELTFARTMRWEGGGARFVRPIRWVAALYGGKVVPFSYAGVAAAAVTHGHLLTSPGAIRLTGSPAAYVRALERRGVVVDHARRRQMIETQLAAAAREAGGRLVEDDALIEQAVFLTESPCAMVGHFDSRYLALPPEVIRTAMREHQGYFSLVDDRGAPLPAFIAVSNVARTGRAAATIRAGYERVLRARLDDARFYFEQDRKVKLADRVEHLKGVVFQERLGTVYDKVQRLARVCRGLAPVFDVNPESAHRAAWLSKADLTTGIVREFPELQGIMGREYARRQGEAEEVAVAIGEHYRPRFAGDDIPNGSLAQLVAVVDKIDTIARCFGAALIPTGSQDPYALRRQGLGVVQILRHRTEPALSTLLDAVDAPTGEQRKPLVEFFRQRIESQAKTEGYRPDLINAVLAVAGAVDRPHLAFRRLKALAAFAGRPAFESLMIA
ncbi:MAG: glycine--tRNA ligase subunit beta, partial [Nitrospiria bacterium]